MLLRGALRCLSPCACGSLQKGATTLNGSCALTLSLSLSPVARADRGCAQPGLSADRFLGSLFAISPSRLLWSIAISRTGSGAWWRLEKQLSVHLNCFLNRE